MSTINNSGTRLAVMILLFYGFSALFLGSSLYTEAAEKDDTVVIDFGEWRFRPDPQCEGLRLAWYADDYDASGWGVVEVPAFWSDTWAGRYLGYGWYRTTFEISEAYDRIEIEFGGVDEQCWIFVNGVYIAEHTVASESLTIGDLWDRPFEIVVPGNVLRTGENVLSILVHASTGQGGIWQTLIAKGINARR